MRKKLKAILILGLIFVAIISFYSIAYADSSELLNTDTTTELLEMKESTKGKLQTYIEQYGSTSYGVAAYVLNTVRIFSIPFCFLGIAVGAIYQYVIGIRKLDVRDRGFRLIIAFVTLLLICQVLPLIFTIVVRGWRG